MPVDRTLENVKVGDILIQRESRCVRLVKVVRLTKRWVYVNICGREVAYRKQEGDRVGKDTWFTDHCVVPVEGEVERHKLKVRTTRLRKELLRRLENKDLTYEALLAVQDTLEKNT